MLVVGAALSALVAVGAMLVLGRSIADAVLGMLTVGASWLAVHTTYTLRYAKHFLGAEPGCIEFQGSDGTPRFSDFAYLSFSLGMAYQVADTDLTTPAIRRTVWAHSMLSFLFGTVIIAHRSTSSSTSPSELTSDRAGRRTLPCRAGGGSGCCA